MGQWQLLHLKFIQLIFNPVQPATKRQHQFITEFTYDCINPITGQHILEIGFGNGKLMPSLLKKADALTFTGIDFSEDMVNAGTTLLEPWISRNEIELHHASIEEMPFVDAFFDGVCTINTLYFWPEPVSNAKEVLRVLKPNGRVCIGIRPKRVAETVPATQFGFKLYEDDEAADLLSVAGFRNVEVRTQTDPPVMFDGKETHFESVVLIGTK